MKWMLLSQKKLDAIIAQRVAQALAVENANYEREILLKQANLQVLQSQINPHFLYNTLECIRGMALLEDKENIADIAWSLSRFFRYSISGKSDIVTLGEELENCEIYARIQNYRFQNRFVLKTDVSHDLQEAALPKLALQPVVENAILHGLKNTVSGGIISIAAEWVGEEIKIRISDNGCGMTPETLAALMENMRRESTGPSGSRHTGIALHNVDRRMKLYFGPEYGVTVYSCEDMGTDVELRLPYRAGGKG